MDARGDERDRNICSFSEALQGQQMLVSVPSQNKPSKMVELFGLDTARDAGIHAQEPKDLRQRGIPSDELLDGVELGRRIRAGRQILLNL